MNAKTSPTECSVPLAVYSPNLKPANLNDNSRKCWDAVNSGIMQIFEDALEISKVAADYFEYFLRLKHSFSSLLSANDKSFADKNEHLQKDIRDFDKMTEKVNGQVSALGDSARKCIENFVRNTAGAENFEHNRTRRSKAWEKYLTAIQNCDKRLSELNDEHDKLFNEIIVKERHIATSKMIIESLNQQREHEMDLRAATRKTLNTLSNMEVERA